MTIDDKRLTEIEGRATRAAKAFEVGGAAGSFLAVQPIFDDIPDMAAEIRRLWARAEELERRCKNLRQCLAETSQAGEERERLRAEATEAWADRLRKALDKFGAHDGDCASLLADECDCGFSAALAAAEPRP